MLIVYPVLPSTNTIKERSIGNTIANDDFLVIPRENYDRRYATNFKHCNQFDKLTILIRR